MLRLDSQNDASSRSLPAGHERHRLKVDVERFAWAFVFYNVHATGSFLGRDLPPSEKPVNSQTSPHIPCHEHLRLRCSSHFTRLVSVCAFEEACTGMCLWMLVVLKEPHVSETAACGNLLTSSTHLRCFRVA